MFRRDKWWNREIEKMRREHAQERAELIATISRLAGKPVPTERVTAPKTEPTPPLWTPSPEQQPI